MSLFLNVCANRTSFYVIMYYLSCVFFSIEFSRILYSRRIVASKCIRRPRRAIASIIADDRVYGVTFSRPARELKEYATGIFGE